MKSKMIRTPTIWICFHLILMVIILIPNCSNSSAQELPDIPSTRSVPSEGLDRVLIIGDSISLGYAEFVTKVLPCVEHTTRNAHDTFYGLNRIHSWLGDTDWDVILFNFGLWDLAHRISLPDKKWKLDLAGPVTVPVEQYKSNLRELINEMQTTGALLIFATMTPVPEGAVGRKPEDVAIYNAAALEVMNEYNIEIYDLNSWIAPYEALRRKPNNVHYTDSGYQILAVKVAYELVRSGVVCPSDHQP